MGDPDVEELRAVKPGGDDVDPRSRVVQHPPGLHLHICPGVNRTPGQLADHAVVPKNLPAAELPTDHEVVHARIPVEGFPANAKSGDAKATRNLSQVKCKSEAKE